MQIQSQVREISDILRVGDDMNLANRIAAKIPIDGVTVEVRRSESGANVTVTNGEMHCGYDITFKFPNIKLEAIHHTNTLNLSNNAIDRMVSDVAVSFRDMIRKVNDSRQV